MIKQSAPYVFSSCVAGLAGALMYWQTVNTGSPFRWAEFLVSVFISALMGLLICMAGHAYGLSYELAGALAGVGGFLGKESVTIMKSLIEKKLGIDK